MLLNPRFDDRSGCAEVDVDHGVQNERTCNHRIGVTQCRWFNIWKPIAHLAAVLLYGSLGCRFDFIGVYSHGFDAQVLIDTKWCNNTRTGLMDNIPCPSSVPVWIAASSIELVRMGSHASRRRMHERTLTALPEPVYLKHAFA
ncbi:hypothetical protein D3C81_1789280 [compost metagenome]